jgi:hypothetical protein
VRLPKGGEVKKLQAYNLSTPHTPSLYHNMISIVLQVPLVDPRLCSILASNTYISLVVRPESSTSAYASCTPPPPFHSLMARLCPALAISVTFFMFIKATSGPYNLDHFVRPVDANKLRICLWATLLCLCSRARMRTP